MKMAKVKTQTPLTAGEDAKQKKFSCIDGENAQLYHHFGRPFGSVLQN